MTTTDTSAEDQVQSHLPAPDATSTTTGPRVADFVRTPVLRTRSARDLQRNPPPPVVPILSLGRDGGNGFLDAGQLTLLFSDPKSGKSWLGLEIARRIATGTPFLGITPATPGPVLYLDFEMAEGIWHHRLSLLEAADPTSTTGAWPDDLHIVSRMDDPNLDFYSDAGWTSIVATVRDLRPVLVVVDTLRAASAEDENSAAVGDFVGTVKQLAYATDERPAMLVLHHTVKSETVNGVRRMAGSGALWARADTIAEIVTKNGTTALIPHGGRFEAPPGLSYCMDDAAGGIRFTRTAAEVEIPETRRDEQRVWEILGHLEDAGTPATVAAVATAWSDGEKPTATIRKKTERTLDRLIDQARVRPEDARLQDTAGRQVVQRVYHPLGRGVRMAGAWVKSSTP